MVECEVCLSPYSTRKRYPVTILCGHTFCCICIKQMFSYSHIFKHEDFAVADLLMLRIIKCPTCRKVTPVRHDSNGEKNILMLKLLKDADELISDDDEPQQNPAPRSGLYLDH